MKAKKKRGVEVPPKIRDFVTSVTAVPFENIEVPLAGFNWEYDKGDFYHWVDLMNHFDSYFERIIRPRKDLQLEGEPYNESLPFPKEAVLQILRVTRVILESCANKYCYSSYEHLSSLFTSTDSDVVTASLQTLAAFVKKPVQSNRAVRWHGDQALNARLFSLVQGWGGKEVGLGLVACVLEDGCDHSALRMGSTLHFEFYLDESADLDCVENNDNTVGLQIIHRDDLHSYCGNDLSLLKEFVDHYRVPSSLRFSLLTRLRFARSFHSVHSRRQLICIRLLAFTILLQSNPDHEDLSAFFANEPEFTSELVALLHYEDSVPEDIRILAVLALAAQAQDRSRQSIVINAISAGGHPGILSNLMQKSISSLNGAASSCSISLMEALLYLVTVLVSSSSGCAALRECGLIPTLLPLLKDTNPLHTQLVSAAVHIMEVFMDYSNPAGTLFRDLGGLDDAVGRLKLEISRVEENASRRREEQLASEQTNLATVDLNAQQTTTSPSETLITFQQRTLLKDLLRVIALGTYAPGNAARIDVSEESVLASCLCTIFRHAKEFGGGVFSLAASVMSDLIHRDPTCYSGLESTGLPAAFLSAITSGVLPSSEAVSCIPQTLDALCLNNSGLQAVKDCNALSCLVKVFTSKSYLRALANETPGSLATGLEELMRHAPSLRGPGVDACIEILSTIAAIGGVSTSSNAVEDIDAPVPMETDGAVPTEQQSGAASSQSLVGISEACLLEYMNNAARLLESLLQNAETCRVFIEKKGVEAILSLYTLPNLPVSFGGSSVAHSMFSVFRAFSPQHVSVLARAVCGALRESLTATLEAMLSLTGGKLFELESSERKRVVRCLTSTELFLSLSSVLVRSTNTMMNEISAGGPTFFTSIGKVYREVLWQISLIDEARAGSKREEIGSNAEAATAGSGAVNTEGTAAREGEDDLEVSPAVQYVNPVSIRDGTSSHWRSESEYFPVMPSGDGIHRRARRDQSAVANFFSVRVPRLARYTHVPQVDLEGASNSGEGSQSQDNGKGVSPDTLDYEMMARLVLSVRGLFVALGKAMVIPSRRRDDVASPGSTAKGIASEIAKLFHDTLGFDCRYDSIQLEAVKCRFFGKVVDDMLAVLFDSRRNTCNTLLVNSFYAHDALGRLLDTFKATCQIFWELHSSDFSMETGTDSDKNEPGLDKRSCLLETLRSYAKLLEHLVTSALLLSPQPMAQLLVQPVAGVAIDIPKDPEALVRKLQLQVLENILPVWKHPLFTKCGSSLVASVASILTQIYSGVVDVKDRRNGDARIFGPPPDESSISTIVEMGFSRERAEEALRRVVTNSVEMAMEWLFSHPEEPQEDDELARALALSLGSSDAATDTTSSKGKETLLEEDNIKIPPVEETLATCTVVLQNNDAAIFPLTDLLVTMCNHNKGEDRARVVAYLVHQLKLSAPDAFSTNSNMLSMISHSLALILNEDSTTREVAAEHGLVTIALDILSRFEIKKGTDTLVTVPKWATALLLVLDLLLQYKPKMSKETEEPAATSNIGAASGSGSGPDHQRSEVRGLVNDVESDPFIAMLGKAAGFLTENEQHHAMTIACNFLGNQIPATTVQAVLQLCARLTKTHSVAMQFLEAGGLTAILNLPRQSLFPGFDSVAAVIIRHLLEDVQILQQAMELEIRHTLMATLQRHNGRVSTRMFLTALAPVVLRNPGVFMQASAAVCQIENIGGRPHIILAKEKDKSKDDKDKGKVGTSGVYNGASCSDGTKAPDVVSKSKGHHKKVPHSFAQVVDQLLEVVLHSTVHGRDCKSSDSAAPMDVEDRSLDSKGKAKCDEGLMLGQGQLSDTSAGLAKVAFILKLMTEILLMYSGAVGVVLRRDSESSQSKAPNQPGSEVVGHGGLLYHILHRLLPYAAEKVNEKSNEDEWKEKLSVKAAYFLLAVCVRSGEGRRRVVSEISRALSSFANKTIKNGVKKVHPPSRKVKAFVFLVNLILSANTSSNAQAPGFSIEMAKVMIDSGLVQSLTSTLQVIDLDHPEAPKLVNAVLKALEVLTRASHSVDLLYATATRADTNAVGIEERGSDQGVHITEGQPSDESQQNGHLVISTSNPGNDPGLSEAQLNAESMPADVNNSRDQNLDSNVQIGQLDSDNADGYLDEASEQVPGQGGTVTADRQFGVGQRIENVVEDDEEMDGDDGEEEDEEDEDEDDMEGAEAVPHLSPPETDVEDHEDNGLGDDYGEDMIEDEDEDDDWQENQVVEVRWRDGLTRFNQVQVLGHGGPAALIDIPGDPFQGMNEIFSSFRRPTVVDRRRPAAAYRPFPERSAGDRGGVFHHPLLERPALPSGVVSTTGAGNSSLWGAAGSISRDADALLTGYDVSHFYMYDPIMSEHMGDRFFAEPPPPLLDFSVDPGYLTGRRGTRSDGRLSTWTDDGQPQAGAYAAALAQGIEQQFICRLRSLLPGEEPAADQTDNNVEAVAEPAGQGDVPRVEQEEPDTRVEGAGSQDAGVPSSADVVMQSEAEISARLTEGGQGNATEGGERNAIEGGQGNTAEEGQDNTQDGRAMRGEEVCQEVTGLVGENLQSSEMIIGSDCNRTISNSEAVEMNVEGVLSSHIVTTDGGGEQGLDEAVNRAATGNDTELLEHQEEPQEEDRSHRQAEYGNRQEGLQEVNTIDPTFLEALPEYLRAEVLASHETQTARAANVPQPSLPTEDIDPEFLAALPPDIQAEVLAQQRAQRLIQAQQVEGQPVEMDSASIIATFPAELREEVLLTSSDQVLAALPPSLLAEAQLLRERAMNQYQTRGLFGGANRIGVRRNNIGMPPGSHSAAERGIIGLSMGRRSANASMKIKEVEGKPLIDIGGLKSILRLLCLAQPLIAKGLLQRLLLNLCGHSVTRANLVKLLLDMLRPRGENSVGSPELSQRLYGCRWNVVYARSQLSDGVPPLVSRRVLEILTHLGKHHDEGADLLTYMEPTEISSSISQTICEEKGKAKLIDEVASPETTGKTFKGDIPLVLLLKLLNQPLYSRSSAHLEQLMGLLDVVTNKLSIKYQQCQLTDSVKAGEDQVMEGDPTTSGTHGTRQDEDSTISGMPGASRQEGDPTTSGVPETSMGEGDAEQSQLGMERASFDSQQSRLSTLGAESNDPHGQEPSTSGGGQKLVDLSAIILSLPKPELRRLCRLLAQEGLSDTAYNRVSEVLKKLATAAPAHRWLFISELEDAARGLSSSAITELHSLGNTDDMICRTSSMAGAAVLRVLQCLSNLTGEGKPMEKDDSAEQKEGLRTLHELNMHLEPLWQELSACIAKLETRLGNTGPSSAVLMVSTAGGAMGSGSLPPETQRVLPFVEAFFALCDSLRFSSAVSIHAEPGTATAREIKEAASSSAPSSTASVSKGISGIQRRPEGGVTFLRFAEKHRKMLNSFVRQNAALLEKSLSLLLQTPRLIDFDNKRAYFRSRIRQQHEQQHYAPLRISVRRAYVLEDSYNQLRMRTPEELKGRLTVQFQGEEGIDAGGLTREWYQLLSRVIFDKGALLFTTVGNESSFQPNPNSVYQTEHLSYFKFVGRVVAKALFDGQLLDVYFTRSFYKHILGVKVTYHDIEAVDPSYYKNLMWMLENDISDDVELFFSVDADEEKHILYEKTEVTDIELIPGGRNVRVTEENKHEYVDLIAEHKLTTAIRPQINAFLEGFSELINRDLITVFNDKELELLISGLPEIDVDDLKANTEYTGYTATSPVVQWFWEVVCAFNKEDMARLMQFITGTSKVPLEGFKALQGISGPQRCQIHKAYGAPDRLPTAHTCFNQLDLPEYSSKEQLQERLLLAIHEGSEGFAFG